MLNRDMSKLTKDITISTDNETKSDRSNGIKKPLKVMERSPLTVASISDPVTFVVTMKTITL